MKPSPTVSRHTCTRRLCRADRDAAPTADVDTLIKHALTALSGCTESDKDLTTLNASVAVVGKGMPFKLIDGDDIAPYVRAHSLPVASIAALTPSRVVQLAAVVGEAGAGEGAAEGAGVGADADEDVDME